MNKKERKKKANEEAAILRTLAAEIMDAIIKNNADLVSELFEKSNLPVPSYYFSVNEYASDPGVLGNIAYYPIKRNNIKMLRILKSNGINIDGEIRFLTDWNSRADQFLSEEIISTYDFAVRCKGSKEMLELIKGT